MSLIFCFLTVQGNSPKQDHGCCECWKIDMGCFMQQSSWDLEVIPDDQFSLCVPTKNISDFLEQLIAPMSSTIRPRHTFHKVEGCRASESLFAVVIIGLLSVWLWPYLPSYSSLSNLPIDIGLFCTEKKSGLCGERTPLWHILALPISVLSMLYLSIPLSREVQSRNDKLCFRKNSAPKNVPDCVYSVWS